MRSTWLCALILLVAFGGTAHARGGKVDWSEYLEPPGKRTPARLPLSDAPAKAATAKAEKAEKKAGKSKAKSAKSAKKARKTKAKAKRRGRR